MGHTKLVIDVAYEYILHTVEIFVFHVPTCVELEGVSSDPSLIYTLNVCVENHKPNKLA